MKKLYFYYRTNWCNLYPRAGSTQMRKVNIKAKWKKEWKKQKEKEKLQQKQISKKQHYPSSRWTGVSIFPVRALSSLIRKKKKSLLTDFSIKVFKKG